MWVCSRCQAENNDAYTQCTQCSAPRSHRRFSQGSPTVTPSLQAQPPERRMRDPAPPETPPIPSRHAAPASPAASADPRAEGKAAPRRAPGAVVRAAGIALAVLLPLLVVLLAALNQATLRPMVAGWFAGPAPEQVFGPTGIPLPPAPSFLRSAAFGWFAYALTALAAALLSMAPGLALWAQGRLLRAMRTR
ncbi:MAG TPA: hypothetical protein VLA21_09810 [Candidatus Limnocylindria bacterium]|nr:hypothetical protein [Candidatus Limnocylindria bacterium]